MVWSFLPLLVSTDQYYDLCCKLHTKARFPKPHPAFEQALLPDQGMQSSLDKSTHFHCTSS